MRVLIAEDDAACRAMLRRFLDGHDSHAVIDGRQAVQAFRAAIERGRPFDLVCLDIMLPLADGHEVLRAIREDERARGVGPDDGVKVIMVTALGDAGDVYQAFRSGCVAYATKPIDRRAFLEQIQSLGLTA